MKIQRNTRIKFYACNATGIIGSNSKKISGKFISSDKKIRLSLPISRRNKDFIDVVVSICFIITFPVHLFTQKKPRQFFKNVFDTLLLDRTWVGYSFPNATLPKIKIGVLTTTGLPASLNTLPEESLIVSDIWYATDYDVWEDVKMIMHSYKFLSA